MTETLTKIQAIELDILKQCLAIIQRHELRYFMLGGTLLGAVRHKGFIPWDDDVDIGMPRPDYDAFLKYAEQELEAPCLLHTIDSPGFPYSYYYARVECTRYKVRRTLTAQDVVNVELTPLEATFAPGETLQMEADVVPAYADDVTVAWRSTDEAVATVDGAGNVVALSPGECEIVVEAGGFEDKCKIVVE